MPFRFFAFKLLAIDKLLQYSLGGSYQLENPKAEGVV